MRREALVMVLDDTGGSLGALSVALVKGGVDVMYANDLDELILLAREQPHPSVLLLAPNELALRSHRRLEKALQIGPAAVLPCGPRPAEAQIQPFRAAGFQWCMWDCADPAAAQYVVAAALWDLDKSELRFEARMPTQLPGTLVRGGTPETAAVLDLGAGGARVRCRTALTPQSEVELRFRLPACEVAAGAHVAWVRAGAGGSAEIGLAFERLTADADRCIRADVSAWMSRYRIAAAPQAATAAPREVPAG